MNPIKRFQEWYRRDTNASKKLLIIAGGVGLALLLILLFLSGLSEPQETTQSQSGLSQVTLDQSLVDGGFDQVERVELVSADKVNDANSFGFSGSDLIYADNKFQLHIGDELFDQQDFAFTYPKEGFDENTFIHAVQQDFYVVNDTLAVVPENVDSPIYSELPSSFNLPSTESFLYLNRSGSQVSVFKTNSLFRTDTAEEVATFTSNLNITFIETVNFNDEPYIIIYDGDFVERSGNMEIWKISSDSVELIQSVQNVFEASYGKRFMMYTTELAIPTEITSLQQVLIEFTDNNPRGLIQTLNLPLQLAQEDILGSVRANRCAFHPTERLLYCLVKKEGVQSFRADAKDEIVIYDIANRNINTPFTAINISASAIAISQQSEIHFIGQSDRQIYKIAT